MWQDKKMEKSKFKNYFFVSLLLFSFLLPSVSLAINTEETSSTPTTLKTVLDKLWQGATTAYEKSKDVLKKTASASYRAGLRYLLQTIARDTATWISSGGKGQKPLFITEGWGAYLMNAADQASGAFIDTLIGPAGFNNMGLCRPDLDIVLKLNLHLAEKRPPVPRCTFSRLKHNWETFITEKSFLPDFAVTFDPGVSELDVAWQVKQNFLANKEKAKEDAKKAREESPFKPITDAVSGAIELPGQAVFDTWNSVFDTSIGGEMEATGDIIADSVDTFMGTLAQGLIKNLMSGMLLGGKSSTSRSATDLTNPEAATGVEGIAGAMARLAQTISGNFSTPGRYNVLSQLVSCPDLSKRGPNDCVITDNFYTAIGQRLTVGEAVVKGLVNGNAPFGFISWDPKPVEPSYTDGIPYRSILILRKYRIVPVGWELAARYVQNFGKKRVTLKEIINAYDDTTSPFYKLVDPNWVLVSPEAFCKLQGAGPEIVSSSVVKGVDLNKDGKFDSEDEAPPTIKVARNTDYCADEQTCIQKDSKGNCKFYGYCTEEKKAWDFKGNSCEPQYSSCATLQNRETGATVSYLLNTVNFANCDESGVGCKEYFGSPKELLDSFMEGNASSSLALKVLKYAIGLDIGNVQDFIDELKLASPSLALKVENGERLTASDAARILKGAVGLYDDINSVYLNKNVESCKDKNNGCNNYIRTMSQLPTTTGVNLVRNPSFESIESSGNPSGWLINGLLVMPTSKDDPTTLDGDHYLRGALGAPLRVLLPINGVKVGPLKSQEFTLSFFARQTNETGNKTIEYRLQDFNSEGNTLQPLDQQLTSSWERFTATTKFSDDVISDTISLAINLPKDADIDAVKLEIGSVATQYTDYGVGVSKNYSVHLKRAPGYLECRPTSVASDIPNEADQSDCQPFARFCKAEEAGCLRYTPTNSTPPITSVRGDVCPVECVGFDTYTQSKTFFESAKFKDLVPKTARSCSAINVGCDEFTNLDKEVRGGEAREYYQQIRFCEKPSGNVPPVFYTWEGTNDTGFQLRSFELKKTDVTIANKFHPHANDPDTGDDSAAPCTNIEWDSDGIKATCKDETRSIDVLCNSDTITTNPDCRQFYNEFGKISYRLLSRTISMTEDCRPLRKTDSNELDCTNSNGWWNSATNNCIYQTVMGENRQCSATAAGCREYRGGTSANYKNIINDTFEKGTDGWNGGRLSPVSSVVGGHSYETAGIIEKQIIINPGSSITSADGKVAPAKYVLSFWARNLSGSSIVEATASGTNVVSSPIQLIPGEVSVADLTVNWQQYKSSPITIEFTDSQNSADVNLKIEIKNSAPVPSSVKLFIDNIILQSTVSVDYLIKNSWKTPSTCYTLAGTAASPTIKPLLGCQTYGVSDGATRNIWQFGASCHNKVVGCEAVIDTKNSTLGSKAPFEQSYNDGEVVVPADSLDYIVNDPKKSCDKEEQGCQMLTTMTQFYPLEFTQSLLINNPDDYDKILCRSDQLQCSAYTDKNKSVYYFKDPVDQVCEYRTDTPIAGWFKKGSTASVADCDRVLAVGETPRVRVAGGTLEPEAGWVGVCPVQANSCRELFDPRSDDGRNIILNSSFVMEDPLKPDMPIYWDTTNSDSKEYKKDENTVKVMDISSDSGLTQKVKLRSRSSYVISAEVATVPNNNKRGEAYIGVDCDTDTDGNPANNIELNEKAHIFFLPTSKDVYERFSTSFYVPTVNSNLADCTVKFGLAHNLLPTGVFNPFAASKEVMFRNVSLKESRISYEIADTLDLKSCVGIVNNSNCVLVDDTAGVINVTGYTFDADLSPAPGSNIPNSAIRPEYTCIDTTDADTIPDTCRGTTKHCSSDSDCQIQLDSNLLVSVKPDRQCAAWLSCRTARTVTTNGVAKNICLEVEGCEAIDSKGNCLRRSLDVPDEDLTYNQAQIESIKNLSGYSKVGFDWGKACSNDASINCNTDVDCGTGQCSRNMLQGHISPAYMSQVGQSTAVPNGDFESISPLGVPSGWEGWANGENFRIVNSPTEAQSLDIVYPREGQGILQVNANHPLPSSANNQPTANYSQFIRVVPGSTYTISADINTLKFTGKSVGIRVFEYKKDKSMARNGKYIAALDLGSGFNWTTKTDKFEVGQNTLFIKLQLAWLSKGDDVCDPATFKCSINQTISCDSLAIDESLCPIITGVHSKCDPSTLKCVKDSSIVCGIRTIEDTLCHDVSGLWYVDDIKIKPALEYQKNENTKKVCRLDVSKECANDLACIVGGIDYGPCDKYLAPDFPANSYETGLETLDYNYAPQSCRLYPDANALSCRYYDDDGVRHDGKRGYCLEYDPQNSNYCLQWWPVDGITNDDIENENSGYRDQFPLYQCLDTADGWQVVVNANETEPQSGDVDPGKFSDIFKMWLITEDENTGKKSVQSVGAEADLNYRDSLVIDTFRSASTYLPYASTGMIDKPGDCFAQADLNGANPEKHEGCEIRMWTESNGDANGDNFDIYVSNDLEKLYLLDHWCEAPACGDEQQGLRTAQDHNGSPELFIDLAWARDDQAGGGQVKGPFRYIVVVPGPHDDYITVFGMWVRPAFSCNAVVQTVNPFGVNRAYSSRISQGSDYKIYTEFPQSYNRLSNAVPFGSVTPLLPLDNPTEWDSSKLAGIQPLFVVDKLDDSTTPKAGQARAGEPYSCVIINTWKSDVGTIEPATFKNLDCASHDMKINKVVQSLVIDEALEKISQLFVQTYGIWTWAFECKGGSNNGKSCVDSFGCPGGSCGYYKESITISNLNSLNNKCSDNLRVIPNKCAVAPAIPEIRVNLPGDSRAAPTITNTGSVSLSFTALVDPDQEPITQYIIDWGDGRKIIQNGLRLGSHPTFENPITLVHGYSFDDISRCSRPDINTCNPAVSVNLQTGETTYVINPRVQIMDNWGWCNTEYRSQPADDPTLKNQVGFYELGRSNDNRDCEDPDAWMEGPDITIKR